MSYLDLTPGSTHATDNAVKMYMPMDEAKRTLAYFDSYQAQQTELERLQAEIRRLTPDHAYARQCRTAKLEALVLLALDNDRLRAEVQDTTRCRRTELVRTHLRENATRYNILKPPTRESVKKVLIKYGYV